MVIPCHLFSPYCEGATNWVLWAVARWSHLASMGETINDYGVTDTCCIKCNKVKMWVEGRFNYWKELYVAGNPGSPLQWPGISQELALYVERCPVWAKLWHPTVEPSINTPLPNGPWEVVGMDMCYLDGKNYLVVVDYLSRFFEVEEIKSTTRFHVIKRLKTIFTLFGIPIKSDNGQQFSSK